MTSTALFDGYLPGTERSQHRPILSQRRTESFASLSAYSLDETPMPSTNHSPTPSMSTVGRMRLGPEGEQQQRPRSPRPPRELEVMPEEEEQRADDEHTLVGSELDEPPSRGHVPRSGSAMPTPTPSTVTFNESASTPTHNQTPTRSGSQRHQQQSSSSTQAQAQPSRKAPPQVPAGSRFR
jgi:hypothetical protein